STNVQWFNTTVGFCGNTLTVCRLPNNFIVTRLDYEVLDTESLYFSFNETDESLILNDSIYLTPKFFSLNIFQDGIYKVKIRITNDEGSWVEETNCFFMDIKTKC